jgi:hydroxymethylpyrimidine pyrophosphatase-like HAD family hydrolase
MKATSPKTYEILRTILERKKFGQRGLHRVTGISLGQINKVTNWLLEKKYIIKNNGYELWDPIGILSSISLSRKLKPAISASVSLEKDRVMEVLKEEGIILARITALEKFSEFYRENVIDIYAQDCNKVKDTLSKIPGLKTPVQIYKEDLDVRDDIKKINGFDVTTEYRTVIDLYCSERAYAAKELVEKLWGLELGV